MTYVLDTDSVVSMVRGLKVRDNPNRRQRDQYKTARPAKLAGAGP